MYISGILIFLNVQGIQKLVLRNQGYNSLLELGGGVEMTHDCLRNQNSTVFCPIKFFRMLLTFD